VCFQGKIIVNKQPKKFCFICYTYLLIFVFNLYVRGAYTFISKLNKISSVKIKKSEFDLSHFISSSKTILESLCVSILLGIVSRILVSSANKIGRALRAMALGKTLMYTRKNNGPKIVLCGTPSFILVHFETVFNLNTSV